MTKLVYSQKQLDTPVVCSCCNTKCPSVLLTCIEHDKTGSRKQSDIHVCLATLHVFARVQRVTAMDFPMGPHNVCQLLQDCL